MRKHQKLISSVSLLETLTPKITPSSILNFLLFWLSLHTRSPAGRGEKLRPKLGIIEVEQEKIDVVLNQTPPGLGLAPTRGLFEESDEGFTCKLFHG